MSKQYVPVSDLNSTNSKVVGISINKHGRISRLRVRKIVNSEAGPMVVFTQKQLQPLNETLDRLGL